MMRCLCLAFLFSFLLQLDAFAATDYCKDKNKDRDKDNITDCDEVKKTRTNPTKKDSNKNKIPDGNEDKNRNGIQNEDEDDNLKRAVKRKSNQDSDWDCLQNEDEDDWGLSPDNADSDGDGLVDGLEDSDGDGILNKDEDDRPGEGITEEDLRCAPPPLPTATPTATPLPTYPPPVNNLNFDADGNVTEIGKIAFGIPFYLNANLLYGRAAHIEFSCSSCHVERGGYSFPQIQEGTSRSPMNTFGLTEQNLADLTAWLNRGRLQ